MCTIEQIMSNLGRNHMPSGVLRIGHPSLLFAYNVETLWPQIRDIDLADTLKRLAFRAPGHKKSRLL